MHIMQLTDEFPTPAEKIAHLDNFSTELSPDVEIAIRVWAQHDPLARSYQERVDQVRLGYLQEISRPFVGSDTHAAVIAQLVLRGLYRLAADHAKPATGRVESAQQRNPAALQYLVKFSVPISRCWRGVALYVRIRRFFLGL